VRPKQEGRFKGSRAMAVGNEAGTTDRLRVGSLTFGYENGSSSTSQSKTVYKAEGGLRIYRKQCILPLIKTLIRGVHSRRTES